MRRERATLARRSDEIMNTSGPPRRAGAKYDRGCPKWRDGWTEPFDADEDGRVQLAKMIEQQIDSIGFALACDFLKVTSFTNSSKPDVHIKEIFAQLGLSHSKDDVEAFRAVS